MTSFIFDMLVRNGVKVSSWEQGDGVSAAASLVDFATGHGGFSSKQLGDGRGVRYARGPRSGSVASDILHSVGGADGGGLDVSARLPRSEGAVSRLGMGGWYDEVIGFGGVDWGSGCRAGGGG